MIMQKKVFPFVMSTALVASMFLSSGAPVASASEIDSSENDTVYEIQIQQDPGSTYKNHGQKVSEAARTIFRGPGHGQAVKAVAQDVYEDSSNEETTDEGAADEGATDDDAIDEGSTDEGTADEDVADEGTTNEGATDEDAADEGATDEDATDEGATDEGATDEGATDEGATDDDAADEGTADEGSTDDDAADEDASDNQDSLDDQAWITQAYRSIIEDYKKLVSLYQIFIEKLLEIENE